MLFFFICGFFTDIVHCYCGLGANNSPINIESELLALNTSMPPIFMDKVIPDNTTITLRFVNSSTTKDTYCEIPQPANAHLKLTGSVLPHASGYAFLLHRMYFVTPSGHTINGVSSPMELRLIYLNNQTYGKNCGETCAMRRKDGVAVVSILFSVDREENKFIKKFLKSVPYNRTKTIKNWGEGFSLTNFNHYYYYEGATTSTPCMNAHWFVGKEKMSCTIKQLYVMQKLFDTDRQPIKKLNGRKVYIRSRLRKDLYSLGYTYGYGVGYHHGVQQFAREYDLRSYTAVHP